jgi:hypothetical protein
LDDFCNSFGLWLLGVVSSYTVGGFIHILLVLALVVLLINIIGDVDSRIRQTRTLFALLDARHYATGTSGVYRIRQVVDQLH